MTSGPLTPPMVLYLSRGLIEVKRGSDSAPIMTELLNKRGTLKYCLGEY